MYTDVHATNRYSGHVLMKLKFSDMFSKTTRLSNFMTIRLVGDEFVHTDGSRDRHDDADSCFLQFCERAYKWRHGPHLPIMEAFSQSDVNRRSFETSTNVLTLLGSTPRHTHKQLLFSRQICISESYPTSNIISKKTLRAVAQWLRCCATNRKVAGSIPDGVIGIIHRHNPSDRTMALGSTQPLTEMSTRSISWG